MMQFQTVISLSLLALVGLSLPASGQRIFNDSQAFFKQGQERLEVEICRLQHPRPPVQLTIKVKSSNNPEESKNTTADEPVVDAENDAWNYSPARAAVRGTSLTIAPGTC